MRMRKSFNSNATFETKRLRMRFISENDIHAIFLNINNDKEVLKYYLDKYLEKEEDMTLNKVIKYCLENERYFFAIELKDTKEVIGMIHECSTPSETFDSSEIGYAIGRKYWNQGYMSEALKAMIDFIFKTGVHKVVVSHLVGNNASKRVIEKCDLIYEGRRKEEIHYHEQYWDVDYYYLLNTSK